MPLFIGNISVTLVIIEIIVMVVMDQPLKGSDYSLGHAKRRGNKIQPVQNVCI